MPRLVIKTAHEPMMVGDKAICMCGLSKNQPFCDKSHLKTTDENDDELYVYGEDGSREKMGGCGCGGNCDCK